MNTTERLPEISKQLNREERATDRLKAKRKKKYGWLKERLEEVRQEVKNWPE